MLKKILINIFLFIAANFIFAQTPQELIEQGNNYYKNNQFEEAIKSYRQIINDGYISAEVYYNLGNTYYRVGKLGYAILNYERALKISPSDEDVIYNLKNAKARTIDRIEELPEIFITEWWNLLLTSVTVEQWLIIVIIFFIIFLSFFAIFLTTHKINLRKISFVFGSITLFILLLVGILLISKINRETTYHYCILVENTQPAKTSPNKQGDDAFVIHEGIKFEVEEYLDNWAKIKLSDGKVGWIPNGSFEKI
ncbi:MAG: tetratricopeptide repeat protein [Ignavibacteriales bacterium]|nr:tetratricopeptide repeat protein [Ignavibacteriales bacterium]